jgi:hypothetical protein
MKRTIPLLVLVSAALTVAACGDSGKTLDTTQVEKDIQGLTADAGVKATAECPDEVKDIKKGTTYECTIIYSGNQNNKQTVQMKVGDNDESEFANQEAVSSEVAIRGIVAQSDEDPASACDHLSDDVLEQLGGAEECPTQAEQSDDGKPTVIKSLKVEGGTATMVTDESTTTFEQDDQGAWVATAIE